MIYVTCETEFTQLQRQSHSGRACRIRDKIEHCLALRVLTRDLLQKTKTRKVTSDINRSTLSCFKFHDKMQTESRGFPFDYCNNQYITV